MNLTVKENRKTGCLSRKDDFFIAGDFTRRLTGGPEEKKES